MTVTQVRQFTTPTRPCHTIQTRGSSRISCILNSQEEAVHAATLPLDYRNLSCLSNHPFIRCGATSGWVVCTCELHHIPERVEALLWHARTDLHNSHLKGSLSPSDKSLSNNFQAETSFGDTYTPGAACVFR